MIKKNLFYIKNLQKIFFLGSNNNFNELTEINKSLKIKTFILSHNKSHKSANLAHYFKQKIGSKFKKIVKENYIPNKTLFISLSSRWIFKKKEIREIFENNLINFHNARLPIDAGGGGYTWRILKNDRIGNILVHQIDEKIDTGKVISEEEFLFPHKCQIPIDFENYEKIKFLKFYENFIKKILSGKKFNLYKQQTSLRRYNPRLNTKKNGWINWNDNSYNLISLINSFDSPYNGASTYLNKKRVFIKKAQLHGGELNNHPFMTGIVFRKNKNWIVVSTRDENSIIIEEVLNERGKNIINLVREGDRFYTTHAKFISSRSLRVKYKAK